MESRSFRICFPETPEWRSARVRLCEVTVCKQGQVFAAVFTLHWRAGRLSLVKGPSSDTAPLLQVQRRMLRNTCSYAFWIIYCMSISCKPFPACCFLLFLTSRKEKQHGVVYILSQCEDHANDVVLYDWECHSRALPHQYTWVILCSAAKSCVSSSIYSAGLDCLSALQCRYLTRHVKFFCLYSIYESFNYKMLDANNYNRHLIIFYNTFSSS